MIIRYSVGDRILFSLIVGRPKTEVTGILYLNMILFVFMFYRVENAHLKKNVL